MDSNEDSVREGEEERETDWEGKQKVLKKEMQGLNWFRTIFNDVLEKVRKLGKQVVGDVDIYDQLLSAPPLIHTINQKDIVSSVSIVNT